MKIHIVQKGDTLWEISKQYGVDFEEVKQLNSHLSSPDMIMPGMKIKIPSTAKAVKKSMPKKETQKPIAKEPYKDISPKPLPVIKEDDEKPLKDIQPEMPMPQMPQMPMQPMMQMPMMTQEFEQDLTINFPQMPAAPKEKPKAVKEKPVQKPKEQPKQLPVQQPMQQPMQQPVHMVPCFPVMHHPCCMPVHPCHHHGPMPFHHMHHPGVLGAQFNDYESSSSMEMPMQQMPTGDCGCKGDMMPPSQQMGYMEPPYGYDNQMQQPYQAQPMQPQQPFGMQQQQPFGMQPQQPFGMQPSQFPPMTNFNQSAYPTPPGFPQYRQEEEESSGE